MIGNRAVEPILVAAKLRRDLLVELGLDPAIEPIQVRGLESVLDARTLGGELSIRPVWHQRADRVQAHIMICFLAYVMWKTLEQWMERSGLGNSPRSVLDDLRAIRSTDVVLPTAAPHPCDLRVRCVVRPEKPGQMLLDRLGLRLPQRLKIRVPTLKM